MIAAKEARDLSKSEEHIEKISNKVEEEIVKAAKSGERSIKIEFPFTVIPVYFPKNHRSHT